MLSSPNLIIFITMNKSILVIVTLFVAALGLWSFTFLSEDAANLSTVNEMPSEGVQIEWITIEEAAKRHEAEPRYWIIDVYTDWCGWCKRMDASTFKDPHVVTEINKHYYAVKFDAEAKRDITFGDKTYKFVPNGRRGYHELAATILNGKMSYPSIAYMSNEGSLIQTIPGFQTAKDIHPVLQYFGSGSYKTVTWEAYQASYESPFDE